MSPSTLPNSPTPRAGRVCSNAFWSRSASIPSPIRVAMASRMRNHSLHTIVSYRSSRTASYRSGTP